MMRGATEAIKAADADCDLSVGVLDDTRLVRMDAAVRQAEAAVSHFESTLGILARALVKHAEAARHEEVTRRESFSSYSSHRSRHERYETGVRDLDASGCLVDVSCHFPLTD